jgi:hypothetical protein
MCGTRVVLSHHFQDPSMITVLERLLMGHGGKIETNEVGQSVVAAAVEQLGDHQLEAVSAAVLRVRVLTWMEQSNAPKWLLCSIQDGHTSTEAILIRLLEIVEKSEDEALATEALAILNAFTREAYQRQYCQSVPKHPAKKAVLRKTFRNRPDRQPARSAA